MKHLKSRSHVVSSGDLLFLLNICFVTNHNTWDTKESPAFQNPTSIIKCPKSHLPQIFQPPQATMAARNDYMEGNIAYIGCPVAQDMGHWPPLHTHVGGWDIGRWSYYYNIMM